MARRILALSMLLACFIAARGMSHPLLAFDLEPAVEKRLLALYRVLEAREADLAQRAAEVLSGSTAETRLTPVERLLRWLEDGTPDLDPLHQLVDEAHAFRVDVMVFGTELIVALCRQLLQDPGVRSAGVQLTEQWLDTKMDAFRAAHANFREASQKKFPQRRFRQNIAFDDLNRVRREMVDAAFAFVREMEDGAGRAHPDYRLKALTRLMGEWVMTRFTRRLWRRAVDRVARGQPAARFFGDILRLKYRLMGYQFAPTPEVRSPAPDTLRIYLANHGGREMVTLAHDAIARLGGPDGEQRMATFLSPFDFAVSDDGRCEDAWHIALNRHFLALRMKGSAGERAYKERQLAEILADPKREKELRAEAARADGPLTVDAVGEYLKVPRVKITDGQVLAAEFIEQGIPLPHGVSDPQTPLTAAQLDEAGVLPADNVVEEAVALHENGINTLVLFSEGRWPSLAGGQTPAFAGAIRSLLMPIRDGLRARGRDLEVAVVTIVDPNAEQPIGRASTSEVSLQVSEIITGEQLQRLSKSREGESRLADVVNGTWMDRHMQVDGRVLGSASLERLVEEGSAIYHGLAVCRESLRTAAGLAALPSR